MSELIRFAFIVFTRSVCLVTQSVVCRFFVARFSRFFISRFSRLWPALPTPPA